MINDPELPPAPTRRILPWLGAVLLAAAIYDGSIFYSRWSSRRAAEQARAEQEAERRRRVVEILGGDTLRILGFAATPGVIRVGGHASLCYGVNGAKSVRLEPPVEEVWPALTHCVEVSPRRDTEYKLIAEDAAGQTVSENFVLKVTR